MRVSLPYGPEFVDVELPSALTLEVVTPPIDAGPAAESGVLRDALDAPIGSATLKERVRGARRATIVVPDGSRPARGDVVVPAILKRLERAGVAPHDVTVLVGGGIHAPPPPADLRVLAGVPASSPARVIASDADDAASFVALPPDPPIATPRLHRAVVETDLVIVTGAVAPHYLAGWSGGAKALVPGCADRATVEAVHRRTLDTTVAPDGSVRAWLGSTAPNAFRAAIERIARHAAPTFAVLSGVVAGRLVHAHAGDPFDAHAAAVAEHRRRFACPRPEPADLVIAGGGAPRDRDLLQAHKGLVAACEVAKEGAPVVWLAHAAEGAGHPRFLPWFEAGRLDRHLAALRRSFHPYGLTAYALRWKAAHHPVHVVSTQVRDVLRPMGLHPFDDAQRAVEAAIAAHRPARCVVLPRALETFFA